MLSDLFRNLHNNFVWRVLLVVMFLSQVSICWIITTLKPSTLKGGMGFSRRSHSSPVFEDEIVWDPIASYNYNIDEDRDLSETISSNDIDDDSKVRLLHVWRAMKKLTTTSTLKDHPLTPIVVSILQQWAEIADCSSPEQNQPEMMGILNKNNLLHEVEESIVALGFFKTWLDQQQHQRHNGNFSINGVTVYILMNS